MAQYNHAAIEKKWRENWEKNPINVNDGKKENSVKNKGSITNFVGFRIPLVATTAHIE